MLISGILSEGFTRCFWSIIGDSSRFFSLNIPEILWFQNYNSGLEKDSNGRKKQWRESNNEEKGNLSSPSRVTRARGDATRCADAYSARKNNKNK
jgi:hypothetical protein